MIFPVWSWHIISLKWQKRTGFCHHRPKTLILPIFRLYWKNCEFLPSKFQCKNWPAIFSLHHGIQILSVILTVWLWHIISLKWQKKNGFCHNRPKMLILPIFSVNCENLWIFTLKVSMQKLTSYFFSSPLYAKLGSGMTSLAVARHFLKVTKITTLVIIARNDRLQNFPPLFKWPSWGL